VAPPATFPGSIKKKWNYFTHCRVTPAKLKKMRLQIMKKGILTLAVVTLISITAAEAYSQGYGRGGRRGPGHGPGFHGGCGMGKYVMMKEELGLTEKQVEKIFRIDTTYREKYFKNRTNRTKIMEIRVEHRKAIESVLTKKQKEKFNSFKRPGRRGYGKGPGRGQGRGPGYGPGGCPDCPPR
jgi:Spy/CpxP family protein refolding chaperone